MLGLREIRALLAQTITPLDCIAAIDLATRHYARRQLTWLRKERGYEWLDLTSIADPLNELQRAAAEFRARRLTS